MSTCPEGHQSASDDYCDVCGSPIEDPSGSTPAPGTAPTTTPASSSGAAPATIACPNCQSENVPDALFCEACGYDFTTGTMPRPWVSPFAAQQDEDRSVDSADSADRPGDSSTPPEEPGDADPAVEPVETTHEPDQPEDPSTPPEDPADTDSAVEPAETTHEPDQPEDPSTPPEDPGDADPAVEPAETTHEPHQPEDPSTAPEDRGHAGSPSIPLEDREHTEDPSTPLEDRGDAEDPDDGSFAWVAELWVDPDWYRHQEPPDPMPSPGLPEVVPLHKRSVLVGRPSRSRGITPDIDCDSDPGASRRQAQLTTDGRRWWVEDLDSSNGTYVAGAAEGLPGRPIPVGQRHELDPDDRIYLGAWTRLVIRRATDEERETLTP